MSLALNRNDYPKYKIDRKQFEDSLQLISDQVQYIEKKLSNKVDEEISQSFEFHYDNNNKTEVIMNKMLTHRF